MMRSGGMNMKKVSLLVGVVTLLSLSAAGCAQRFQGVFSGTVSLNMGGNSVINGTGTVTMVENGSTITGNFNVPGQNGSSLTGTFTGTAQGDTLMISQSSLIPTIGMGSLMSPSFGSTCSPMSANGLPQNFTGALMVVGGRTLTGSLQTSPAQTTTTTSVPQFGLPCASTLTLSLTRP
jgi:hypothetical protein